MILLPARASQIARLLMNSYSFLVELYGSSTQECGVDRGAESSDTSSLNERLAGDLRREKDLCRVIACSRFVG